MKANEREKQRREESEKKNCRVSSQTHSLSSHTLEKLRPIHTVQQLILTFDLDQNLL